MSKYKYIKTNVSEDGTIYTCTLNNPKKLNALSFESLGEIEKFVLEEVNPFKSKARVMIINAVGKCFTSGLDLKSAMQVATVGSDIAEGEEEPDTARKSIMIQELVLAL